MTAKVALPPSVAPDARLLILGSLPGEHSLGARQYYAHPSNAFWWLLGEVIEEALVEMPYQQRLERLKAYRIGLWDVIDSAERLGSLDSTIRNAVHRDLAGFAATLPELHAIAFNGGEASRRGRRQLAGIDRYTLIDLPSSSAAHAGMPRATKREAWIELRRYIGMPML